MEIRLISLLPCKNVKQSKFIDYWAVISANTKPIDLIYDNVGRRLDRHLWISALAGAI